MRFLIRSLVSLLVASLMLPALPAETSKKKTKPKSPPKQTTKPAEEKADHGPAETPAPKTTKTDVSDKPVPNSKVAVIAKIQSDAKEIEASGYDKTEKSSSKTADTSKSKSKASAKPGEEAEVVARALMPDAKGTDAPKSDDTTHPEASANHGKPAQVSSFSTEEIIGFDEYAPSLQAIIEKASTLTQANLTYTFGSADPKNGGMDCSGTVYRVLQDSGFKETPRQSDEICRWVMKQAVLHRTENPDSLKHVSLSSLKPGDLLFWSGTYESALRDPPITHVMLYLGRRKKDGKAIVFGASDGRSYDGQRRCGVSVFDFVLPQKGSKAAFYGYGEIPAKGK